MTKKRTKKYTPQKSTNPIILGKKLEELRLEVEMHSMILKTVILSYDQHVAHLANFANHDMKNSLQSMDSILYNNEYNSLNEESWNTIKTCLKNIRNSFENFSNLVPYSNSKTFRIERLFIALDLLIKQDMIDNKVDFKITNPKGKEINLPFQGVLQMLHNIIINAINSFKVNMIENPIIKLNCQITENNCEIKISDNGKEIDSAIKDKIFDYGFSTTNGSGIGLFHAKYVCKELNGTVILKLEDNSDVNKSFIINLPLQPN